MPNQVDHQFQAGDAATVFLDGFAITELSRGDGVYGLYAKGFFEAGHVIAEQIRDGHGYVDLLPHPMQALYRHGVELYLKELLDLKRREEGGTTDQQSPTHDLQKLWSLAFEYWAHELESPYITTQEPPLSVDEVRTQILRLHQEDERGTTYRYPRDRVGNQNLPSQRVVYANEWLEPMKRLLDTFEIWCSHIEESVAFREVSRRSRLHEAGGP